MEQNNHYDYSHYGHYAHPLPEQNYPPAHAINLSRSFSQHSSSGSSFVKKHGLTSEESLQQPPLPTKGPVDRLPAEPKVPLWSRLLPKSWPIRLYLATVILETIFDLAIQGDIYSRIKPLTEQDTAGDKAQKNRKVVMYLVLFAFAHIFQLALAIEAVVSRNTLQFIFLTAFNLTFLIYSIIEASEIRSLDEDLHSGITSISIKTLTILSHVVIGLAEVAYVALGYQIWREFGWKVFKFLGADIQIKRIFAHYQVFLSLLRFDMFFGVGFSAQLVYLVLGKADAEYYLTIGALPLGVLILIGGHFAARYENKWLMMSFMVGCVCGAVYFSYKLFRIYEGINSTYAVFYKSMTVFASLSLLFLLLSFIWGCIVLRNFGRGLKEQMSKYVPSHKRRATAGNHFEMTATRPRMSIE